MTTTEYNAYVDEIMQQEEQAINENIDAMNSYYGDMIDEVFNQLKEDFIYG